MSARSIYQIRSRGDGTETRVTVRVGEDEHDGPGLVVMLADGEGRESLLTPTLPRERARLRRNLIDDRVTWLLAAHSCFALRPARGRRAQLAALVAMRCRGTEREVFTIAPFTYRRPILLACVTLAHDALSFPPPSTDAWGGALDAWRRATTAGEQHALPQRPAASLAQVIRLSDYRERGL